MNNIKYVRTSKKIIIKIDINFIKRWFTKYWTFL